MDEIGKGQEKQAGTFASPFQSHSLHCNIEGCKTEMSPEQADLPTLDVIREKLGERFVCPEDLPRFAICKGCGYKARRMGAKTYRYVDTFEELKRRAQEHVARTRERDAIREFFQASDALDGGDGRRPENHRLQKEKR